MNTETNVEPILLKDHGDFPSGEIVTTEIREAILRKLNRPHLELVDFTAKEGTKAGDGYAALVYCVKFDLRDTTTGEKLMLPLMLKVMPRNEVRMQMLNESKFFYREVRMYQEIIPAIEEFLQSRVNFLTKEELCTPWPKCYGGHVDGKDDYLAMEDLKVQGYKMGNRQIGLDFHHCRLVLQTMARFHATTFAMFQGSYDKMIEKYPWLMENMFQKDKQPALFRDFFSSIFNQQATLLRQNGMEGEASLLDTVYSDTFSDTLFKLCGAKVPHAVLGHGDCWTNNFLFRYDENNKPVDVKFVDYQQVRAASRTVDLHYFIHSSPQMSLLNERQNALQDIYHEEFSRFLSKLVVNVEGFNPDNHCALSKENFENEIQDFRFYGCVTGLMLSMVTSADVSDVPELESLTPEDITGGDTGNNAFASMIKGKALEKIRNIVGRHLPRCNEYKDNKSNC